MSTFGQQAANSAEYKIEFLKGNTQTVRAAGKNLEQDVRKAATPSSTSSKRGGFGSFPYYSGTLFWQPSSQFPSEIDANNAQARTGFACLVPQSAWKIAESPTERKRGDHDQNGDRNSQHSSRTTILKHPSERISDRPRALRLPLPQKPKQSDEEVLNLLSSC